MNLAKNRPTMFALIVLLAAVLRLVYLDKGYNSDEGWLLRAASQETQQIIPYLKQQVRSVYPPLGIFLLHFWMKISSHEPWVRLYFVLFGIALCIMLYHTGKLLLAERFGLLVFFLSAISPMLIWASQFIRSYSDAAFWSILSVYFMLKIIKNGASRRSYCCYIISSSLMLYTSYLTFLVLISQGIFILILRLKDFRFLLRWLILQVIIAIIFIPCLGLLFRQQGFARGIDLQWGERGFQLLGFNIGHYARSIMAAFGIDPYFLTVSLAKEDLSKIVLISAAAFLFFITVLCLRRYFINVKKFIKNRQLIWFFPLLFASTLIIYNFLAEVKGFPVLSRYFIQQHILFLFIIAGAAYPLGKNQHLNNFLFIVISTMFILFFPGAIKPEFDAKKAYRYLEDKIKAPDCLLMLRNTNYYLDPARFNAVILQEYLKKEDKENSYKEISPFAENVLLDIKNKYKTVWFYRSYGNDEIFGGNILIINWLRKNGYSAENVQSFRRIEIICYKRMD